MRINKYVAQATGLSRRAADSAIAAGQVLVNGVTPDVGYQVQPDDSVTLNGKFIRPTAVQTIMLNKPVGYVCSRDGQGSKTIYDLLPPELHQLKTIGRLDKDSSGLILLTNNGELANQLTHPRYAKEKVYEISLNRSLEPNDKDQIEQGVKLEDGVSKLALKGTGTDWIVTMSEGKNRQIRRTFSAQDYTVKKLHRTRFGEYYLGSLKPGQTLILS
jgi:23S rRNA pseudouridine2605 synthase